MPKIDRDIALKKYGRPRRKRREKMPCGRISLGQIIRQPSRPPLTPAEQRFLIGELQAVLKPSVVRYADKVRFVTDAMRVIKLQPLDIQVIILAAPCVIFMLIKYDFLNDLMDMLVAIPDVERKQILEGRMARQGFCRIGAGDVWDSLYGETPDGDA